MFPTSHPNLCEKLMGWNAEECRKYQTHAIEVPQFDSKAIKSKFITRVAWHPTEFQCNSGFINWIAWHPTDKVFLLASEDHLFKKIEVTGRKVREREECVLDMTEYCIRNTFLTLNMQPIYYGLRDIPTQPCYGRRDMPTGYKIPKSRDFSTQFLHSRRRLHCLRTQYIA